MIVFTTLNHDGLIIEQFMLDHVPTWDEYVRLVKYPVEKISFPDFANSLARMEKDKKATFPHVRISFPNYVINVIVFKEEKVYQL